MSTVAKKIMMGSGAVALPSDDQFNRVSFLSHFEGSNNGVNNAFDDGSTSNHTITANGDVTQGSFGPFARPDGEWGWSFDGDGDYLTVADSTEFDFGTGNFTIEGWINPAVANSSFKAIFSIGLPVQIYSYNNSVVAYFNDEDNASSYIINGLTGPSSSLSANTWAHFAVVRNGNSFTAYVNGVAGSSLTSSDTVASSSSAPAIGTYLPAPTTYEFNGYISNLRLVKGTAVYTSNFTPSTSKLTAITNTKLLTCQSNRFLDNSASGHAITPTGTPAITAFGPFLTSTVYDPAVNGASAYFDGNVDRLHTPEDASTRIAASNFTFEAWVYPTTTTVANDMIFTQGAPGVYSPFNVYILGTTVRIYISTNGTSWNIASNSTSSNSVKINAWNHIALVRNGTTIGLYINGVADNTYAVSTTAFFTPTRETSVGGRDGEEYFTGYITDARLVIGTAVYTSAFTPPTAPLTAITNTKLLLNMADGQAIDSAAQNNLTLIGNTDTSTGQAKFGNTSLFYDGSGDGAYYENGAALGTGDWTIETFLWVNDFDADLGVFQYGGAVGALGGLVLTNQKIRVVSNNQAVRLETSGTINAQTWYHVAYVSYNGTIKVYINGTADSTTFDASSTTWTFTDTTVYVGARYYSSAVQAPFDGYLDEFRVSHFARYTSNFTAPTKAFADKGQQT